MAAASRAAGSGGGTGAPSPYEITAWTGLHAVRERSALRERTQQATDATAKGLAAAGDRVRSAAAGSQRLEQASSRLSSAAGTVADRLPDAAKQHARHAGRRAGQWGQAAVAGGLRVLNRVGTSHLTPDRVVRAHQRRGHGVSALHELRALDLELIDRVKPRHLDLRYESVAALSGAATGLVISGAEIVGGMVTAPTAGAAAAPTLGAISAAISADTAVTLSVCAGVVGHVALHYGYDVARAEERLFVLSVVNLGSAATTSAKYAAYRDISRLTQALARASAWRILNQSPISSVVTRFAQAFSVRLTKRQLAKAVPLVGVAAGAMLNWYTVERIAEAAEFAYRRRFLLDKYPSLASTAPEPMPFSTVQGDDAELPDEPDTAIRGGRSDGRISIVDTAIAAGILESADAPEAPLSD